MMGYNQHLDTSQEAPVNGGELGVNSRDLRIDTARDRGTSALHALISSPRFLLGVPPRGVSCLRGTRPPSG